MHVPSSSDEEGGQGPSAALSNSVRMVVDALAGALSGCVARVVVGPLDVIKIRFQVQQGEPNACSASTRLLHEAADTSHRCE